MNKRRLYILSLWVATLSVLLSTVMTHHHHMGRICMVEQECQQDGNINDEHTEHHDEESEGDRENCRVHQMHQFVTNAKFVKGIKQHILDGSLSLDCGLPLACFWSSSYSFIPCFSLITARRQHRASVPLPDGALDGYGRRGPPSFLLVS